jgi:hypothetical protein
MCESVVVLIGIASKSISHRCAFTAALAVAAAKARPPPHPTLPFPHAPPTATDFASGFNVARAVPRTKARWFNARFTGTRIARAPDAEMMGQRLNRQAARNVTVRRSCRRLVAAPAAFIRRSHDRHFQCRRTGNYSEISYYQGSPSHRFSGDDDTPNALQRFVGKSAAYLPRRSWSARR